MSNILLWEQEKPILKFVKIETLILMQIITYRTKMIYVDVSMLK